MHCHRNPTAIRCRATPEAQLPPDKQRQVQEWRQYDATRLTVDPSDAARDYLKGQGGEAGQ